MKYIIEIRDENDELHSDGEFDDNEIRMAKTVSILKTMVMKDGWSITAKIHYGN